MNGTSLGPTHRLRPSMMGGQIPPFLLLLGVRCSGTPRSYFTPFPDIRDGQALFVCPEQFLRTTNRPLPFDPTG
jgi:hypothetical protein